MKKIYLLLIDHLAAGIDGQSLLNTLFLQVFTMLILAPIALFITRTYGPEMSSDLLPYLVALGVLLEYTIVTYNRKEAFLRQQRGTWPLWLIKQIEPSTFYRDLRDRWNVSPFRPWAVTAATIVIGFLICNGGSRLLMYSGHGEPKVYAHGDGAVELEKLLSIAETLRSSSDGPIQEGRLNNLIILINRVRVNSDPSVNTTRIKVIRRMLVDEINDRLSHKKRLDELQIKHLKDLKKRLVHDGLPDNSKG